MPRDPTVDVYTEGGAKRAFAGAIDWPGWCRSGRDEDAALETLVAYRPRYAAALSGVGVRFPASESTPTLRVVERLNGDSTTDFGTPSIPPAADSTPVDATELPRLTAVLEACWAAFDRVAAATVGVKLTKGPRGGGRDLGQIVGHVARAEANYVRRLAAPAPKVDEGDEWTAIGEMHRAAVEALSRAVAHGLPETGPRGGAVWTPRYFVRRSAWHVLDHAWEIEDRVVR